VIDMKYKERTSKKMRQPLRYFIFLTGVESTLIGTALCV